MAFCEKFDDCDDCEEWLHNVNLSQASCKKNVPATRIGDTVFIANLRHFGRASGIFRGI